MPLIQSSTSCKSLENAYVEKDIDPFWRQSTECICRLLLFIVESLVALEILRNEFKLFVVTNAPNGCQALMFRQLNYDLADRTSGSGNKDGFPSLWLTNVIKGCICLVLI